jgi:ribose transport system ATP-binding protein
MLQQQIPAPTLRMEKISKSFGATRAVEAVDFELKIGGVHALLGENGAGKSTLVKILSGAIKPDRGAMFLEGLPYSPSSPLDGRRRGISMIYQELNLAPHLTVEENIMLGSELHSWGFARQKAMREKVREALDFVHHPEISPDILLKRLSIGARQVVEIARALIGKAKILIMDEPTSSLSQEDTILLFDLIKKLKSQGVSIIYISHFLEEVQQVADSFTVLRDGKKVGTGNTGETSLEELIRMMVGQEVKEMFPRVEHKAGEVLLNLQKLKGKKMQKEVDLKICRGEIMGIAGLIGSGRTEMLRTAFGLDSIEKGSIIVANVETFKGTPWQRIKQGMGYLSEDRQQEGLALAQSLADNVTLSHFSPYSRLGFLRLKKRQRAVWDLIEGMKIKARSPKQRAFSLSGGNQQKVALARLLHQKADILLLDEPTRGIDVVSKSQIYEEIGELASQGKAIIFISSYFPELLGICDKIAVFHRGELTEVRPSDRWNTQSLMAAVTTGKAL